MQQDTVDQISEGSYAEIQVDQFLRVRGGHARLLHVRCARCDELVFEYQKDGAGPLLRCYIARVLAPAARVVALRDIETIEDLRPLDCTSCGLRLGDPMRYSDGRLAYRMHAGAFWLGDGAHSPDLETAIGLIASDRGLAANVLAGAVAEARATMTPVSSSVTVEEHGYRRAIEVTRLGFGPLDTDAGPAVLFEFALSDHWRRYQVVAFGDVDAAGVLAPAAGPLLVRLDSGCVTGQVFGDRSCDCRAQLSDAMHAMARRGSGLVVHLPEQDGRGCGIAFKLGTLRLQEGLGLDTVDAACLLSLSTAIDLRTYAGAVAVLRTLGVGTDRAIELLSNNPAKRDALRTNGYDVILRPQRVAVNERAVRHLAAKRDKLGHEIALVDASRGPAT